MSGRTGLAKRFPTGQNLPALCSRLRRKVIAHYIRSDSLLSIGFVILTRLSFEKAIKQFFIVTISIVAGMLIPYFSVPLVQCYKLLSIVLQALSLLYLIP